MEREKAEPSLQMQGNQVTLILTLGRVWMRGSTVDRDLRMLSGEACRDQLRRGRGRQDWTEGRLAMGAAPWRSQWIPTRSNDAARGALRLSHPRRAGWLLPLGGQSLGEGFLPLAAGNPQRGLSRELATPQPSSWGKGVLPS